MVAPLSSSLERHVPNVYEVQSAFHQLLKYGDALHSSRLTAAQAQLQEMVREHTRTLLYMETHGVPDDTAGDAVPFSLVPLHAVYDGACTSIQDSIAGLMQAQQTPQQTELRTECVRALLQCVEVLVQALGWVLQPASSTTRTAETMTGLQQRLDETAAQAAEECPSPSGDNHNDSDTTAAVSAWLDQAQASLSDLALFVTATYPSGAWFANRNRRATVRSRRLRHPSDIDDAPFTALLRAARSTEDDDVTLLSEVLRGVAQAHTQCLATVRVTETRPTDTAALAAIFAPLNAAINTLSTTCEDVISRREEDRPHAHAVLEAGNLFTWLTTKQEPCVVAEEAYGSANTYLNKITARGNVLLLQQETGFAVDRPDLTKATVTWASMLREVLQRVMLMVVYRYPRHVPWGEMVEAAMTRRSAPRPPSEPRRGSREGEPVWRRGGASAAAAAEGRTAPRVHQQQEHQPAPPASLPPPPPPEPTAASAAAAPRVTSPSPSPAEGAAAPPSCTYDAVTQTWTVQSYHQPLISPTSGAEQEPVYVVLPEEEVHPSHLVRIHRCFNTYVTVPAKVKGVSVQHCQHTKLQLAGSHGPVRIADTEKQEMLIETSAPSVHATRVTGLVLHLAGSHAVDIVTKLTTDVNVNVMVEAADGEQEVRELALPAQYISTITGGDVLTTKEVTYS